MRRGIAGGSANRLTDEHADIDVAPSKTRYAPRRLRLLAVKAELKERAKPEGRDAGGRCPPVRGDGAHAAVPGGRCLAGVGVEGLRARGGQGRKRDISKEDVARAVRDSIESSMEEGG